jgi:hypothetical protein
MPVIGGLRIGRWQLLERTTVAQTAAACVTIL